jgi:DNA-binding transcriptional regulator LsrR (DeoR family)
MTTTLVLLLALLLLPVLILLWATESTEQRARRLRRSYGWSQQRIADHMNISRYAVRRALA